MKWNASLVAALSLTLAACGGGRSYSDYAPQMAPAPGRSIAAQSWQSRDAEPLAAETWRGADGSVRTRPTVADASTPVVAVEPLAPVGASYVAPSGPQQSYPDPTIGAGGPRGSSQPQAGELRYDEIGYAGVQTVESAGATQAAIVAAHKSLAPNTIVEVTALDSGRTILVLVTGLAPDSGNAIELSAGAARELGYDGAAARIPVRVRKVAVTGGDMLALRSGGAAAQRPDTPPVLLTALRKRLPVVSRQAAVPPAGPVAAQRRPAPVQAARPVAVRGGYYVQVAALSNARNAQALAQSMGGFVKQGGGLHRVQLGPFANQREAETARAGAARAGYGDARVFAVN